MGATEAQKETLTTSVSDAELQRRWKAVRARMEAQKIDVLVTQNRDQHLGGYVQWFTDIDAFVATRSISPHDYDLGFHLLFLRKLHKISHVRILGIPQSGYNDEILSKIIEELRAESTS